jgi:hypothetical protein
MADRAHALRFNLKSVWRTEGGMKGPQARFMLQLRDENDQLVPYDWITFSEAVRVRYLNDPQRDERVIECAYFPQQETLVYDPNEEAKPTWDCPRVRAGGWRIIRACESGVYPSTLREANAITKIRFTPTNKMDYDAAPHHASFSYKEKAQIELPPDEETNRALAAVRALIEREEKKAFDLYWLGRRNVDEVLADPDHPSFASVNEVFAKYPQEAQEIADGDAWKHGVAAGKLAILRRLCGLVTTEWQDWTGCTDDPEHPWQSPEGARLEAMEEEDDYDS